MDDSGSGFLMRLQSCSQLGPQLSQGLTGAGESDSKMAHPHGGWQSVPCWPLGRGLSSLPHGSLDGEAHSMAAGVPKTSDSITSEKQNNPDESSVPFKDTVSEVTYCHFRFFSFFLICIRIHDFKKHGYV